MTKSQSQKIRKLSVLISAIKLRCLDCSAGSLNEVKKCPCLSCALFPYRLGIISKVKKIPHKKVELETKIITENEEVME